MSSALPDGGVCQRGPVTKSLFRAGKEKKQELWRGSGLASNSYKGMELPFSKKNGAELTARATGYKLWHRRVIVLAV